MTRHQLDDGSHAWVMRCDRSGCNTQVDSDTTADALKTHHDAGWFIGRISGDRCPDCVAVGHESPSTPFRFRSEGES